MRELPILVQAAQCGDHDAFGEIVARFQDMAYASAYAIVGDAETARDATQEAFLDAYCNLNALRDPAAFPGWFRRIVSGRSHRQLRRNPSITVPLEDAGTLYDTALTPTSSLEASLLRHDVHAAIRTLPPGQQQVTVLYYVGGYSLREIADYLELSPGAVKKRLFDARHSLKERMAFMTHETIQQNRPSQDDQMTRAIALFTALIAGDAGRVAALLDQDGSLLTQKIDFQMALRTHFWPLGFTPLHMAVSRGNRALTELLIERLNRAGIKIDLTKERGMTPLHTSAIMNRPALAELLVENGASVTVCNGPGHTPLHHAALRNNEPIVELLLKHGADATLADERGQTPADWAAARGYDNIVAQLVAAGATEPGPVHNGALPQLGTGPILETGIKPIDLLTPLPRGGAAGIFTPLAGVGYMVLLGELIRSVQDLYDGRAICAGVESFNNFADDLQLSWREWGVEGSTEYYYSKPSDDAAAHLSIMEQSLDTARKMGQNGHEVLLFVESNLAVIPGVWSMIQEQLAAPTGEHAITILVHGKQTVELLPPPLGSLQTRMTFDRTLANQRLYPAIDPVRSRSGLLSGALKESDHAGVAEQVRRLLLRYADLYPVVESGGVEALWYIDTGEDVQQDVARARRLQRFLTQPFYGAEPWTGIMGASISLAETLRGCREILDGKYDDVTEEAFRYVGAIDEVKISS